MPGQRLPPYEQHSTDLGDVRLHYAELPGPGRPLLLLHGIGMDWRVWQGVSRRLHSHFHLYFADLRGHGASDKPAAGYSLAHYAADIEDLLDRLDLHKVILVGSSLGGMVAVSVEAPVDIVSHRVLVDPPMTGGPIRDSATFRDILVLKHRPRAELAGYLGAQNPGAGTALLRTMSEMWHEAADGVITEMLADDARYFAIDGALRADESPTLLMQADPALGAALSPAGAQHALSLLPHGRLVTVNGAGHAIHAYKPAEFTRLIVDFTT